jgi:hypothetical protein
MVKLASSQLCTYVDVDTSFTDHIFYNKRKKETLRKTQGELEADI